MAQMPTTVSVKLDEMPAVLWVMRRELARLLRKKAGSQADPKLAKALREVAAAFEAGASAEDLRA